MLHCLRGAFAGIPSPYTTWYFAPSIMYFLVLKMVTRHLPSHFLYFLSVCVCVCVCVADSFLSILYTITHEMFLSPNPDMHVFNLIT